MWSRYILIFLGIISLFWIVFVGVNLIDINEEFSPKSYFGKKDGEILVVNRLDEFNFKNSKMPIPKNIFEVYEKISPNLQRGSSIYFSKYQSQFLIQKKDKWQKDEVLNLFDKSNMKIDFSGSSKFTFQDFIGEFHGTMLHIYKSDVQFPIDLNVNWLSFDHKASASIIRFEKGDSSFIIDDVYYKKDGRIDYISKGNGKQIGGQVDDEDLFSGALPKDIEEYHFYEKNYYSNLDKIYKKSPMHYWIESGFVELEYNSEKVLITDYSDSKDPFLLLDEVARGDDETLEESSTYFKNIRLTKDFPLDIEKGFYIYKMDDYIVISTSKSVCNEILMAIKNTDASLDTFNFYLKSLPKKVSERLISRDKNYSKTIYKNKIIETFIN